MVRFARPRTWIGAACLLLGGARTAHADGTSGLVSLRWSAPAGCPDAEAVRRRVLALAGPGVALSADAQVREEGGELRVVLHVQVRGTIGERVLTAATCEAAAESVAVVLALSAAPSLPPEPPAPLPFPPPRPEPPPIPPLPPPPPAPSPRRSLVRLSAEGSLDLGTLPEPTLGATLRATVTPVRGVEVGLAGALWLDRDGFAATRQGADFSLLTLDAVVCYGWRPRRSLELSPCAVVELGRISATGISESQPGSSAAYWVGFGLGARGRWELTRWLALAVEVDGMIPTEGQSFSIQGPAANQRQQVSATSVVAARVHFGPEVRF